MSGTYGTYPQTGGSSTGSSTGVPYVVGAIDSAAANANGATIGSFSLYMQSASTSNPGLVNNAAQSFNGIKSFTSPTSHAAGTSGSPSLYFSTDSTSGLYRSTTNAVAIVSLQNRIAEFQAQGSILYSTVSLVSGGSLASPTLYMTTDSTSGFYAQGANQWGFGIAGTNILSVGSVGMTVSTLSASAPVKSDANKVLVSGSISLTADVTGKLPLSNTTGSISLVNQVVGNLPLSQTSGSISLTNQVVGLLPEYNIGSLSASYLVGTIDGASAKANGATIGTNSLFLQSASTSNPGLMNMTAQSFGGNKSFTSIGVNDASSTSAVFIKASSTGIPSFTIKGLAAQTSNGFEVRDSANNPKVIYDMNAGAFRLFVNDQEAAECNFDNRATVVTAAINSGSAARFNFICAQQSAIAANTGAGIAFGATVTGTTSVTEYGYVWATKNNANAGDDDGTLHFASRSNATGKAVRCLDFNELGNAAFYGKIAMSGALNGAVTFSAGSSVAAYTLVLPSAQGGASTQLQNDGNGNLTWANAFTNPTTTSGDLIVSSGSGVLIRLPINSGDNQVLKIMSSASSANIRWGFPDGDLVTASADRTIEIDFGYMTVSSGCTNISMPTAGSKAGQRYSIKKSFQSTEAIVIGTVASQTFENGPTQVFLDFQYEAIEVMSDGNNWLIKNRYIPEKTFPLTLGGSGVSANGTPFGRLHKTTGSGSIQTWFLHFSLDAACTSSATPTVTLNSSSFTSPTDRYQGVAGASISAVTGFDYCRLDVGSANLTFQLAGVSTRVLASGYVSLGGKPILFPM